VSDAVSTPENVRLERLGETASFLLRQDVWLTMLAAAREAGWQPERPEHLYSADLNFAFSGSDAGGCAAALERILDAPDDPSGLDRLMLSVAESEWRALIAYMRRGGFHVRSC
jgi:hypothetical protein